EWKRFRASTTPRLAARTRMASPVSPSASAVIGAASLGGILRGGVLRVLALAPGRRRLHGPEPVPGRPGGRELPAERVETVLVEQELAAVAGGEVECPEHDDRVGRTDLDAQLAELAGVELEREELRVVPLLGLQHLDLDDLRRANELTEPAAAPVLRSGLRIVGVGDNPPEMGLVRGGLRRR